MMVSDRRVWQLVVLIGVLLATPAGLWAQQPKFGGTLRIAWEADVTGLDPHMSSGLQAQWMVGNLFNSLITIDEQLNYIPELAESWETKDNGKTLVFHLRKGVKFHDGTDFDAEAVKFNFLRITGRLDPERKPFAAPFFTAVESVEPLDAHTVQFSLKAPNYTVIPAIAVYRVGFLQMSPTAYKTYGKKEIHLHPTGTGAFKFVKWEPNNIIVLEKNPAYFKKGLPYLDRLEFRVMKEGVTRPQGPDRPDGLWHRSAGDRQVGPARVWETPLERDTGGQQRSGRFPGDVPLQPGEGQGERVSCPHARIPDQAILAHDSDRGRHHAGGVCGAPPPAWGSGGRDPRAGI